MAQEVALKPGTEIVDFPYLRTYNSLAAGDDSPIPIRVVEHPDGVYLGLDELRYLNDWGLSYSAFKTINSSPPDWWWGSAFNLLEDQEQRSTPALRFGSALHAALLESLDHFKARYGVPPVLEDYPKALKTNDDMKAALKKAGVTPSGTTKAFLIRDCLDHIPGVQIFEHILAQWRKKRLVELTVDQWRKIFLMERVAQAHPDLKKAFGGVGLSEVSVFWTDENGIRQRARFDRLKANASIDLKSFSNWQGRDFDKALLREAALRQYDLQAAHYDEARHQMRRLLAEGKVFAHDNEEVPALDEETGEPILDDDGEPTTMIRDFYRTLTVDERNTLEAVLKPEKWDWVWVFYKTDGAPRAQPVRLQRDTKAFNRGVERRAAALAMFAYYREQFGVEKMWMTFNPIWTPDDTDWPFFMEADS